MTALPAPGSGHGLRLVLCDDHVLFVEPLAVALRLHGHDVVVATSPADVIPLVRAHAPDLCVVDLHFPDGDGVQLIAELRQRHPSVPVVVLSASAEPREGAAAIRAGAAGILRKDQPISAIYDAIERISAGRRPESPPAPRRSATTPERSRVRARIDELTDRERDVLRRLVLGEDTVAIARTMRIAASTARTHLQNVLLKLGVHSRLQAVALVVGAGLEDEL